MSAIINQIGNYRKMRFPRKLEKKYEVTNHNYFCSLQKPIEILQTNYICKNSKKLIRIHLVSFWNYFVILH